MSSKFLGDWHSQVSALQKLVPDPGSRIRIEDKDTEADIFHDGQNFYHFQLTRFGASPFEDPVTISLSTLATGQPQKLRFIKNGMTVEPVESLWGNLAAKVIKPLYERFFGHDAQSRTNAAPGGSQPEQLG